MYGKLTWGKSVKDAFDAAMKSVGKDSKDTMLLNLFELGLVPVLFSKKGTEIITVEKGEPILVSPRVGFLDGVAQMSTDYFGNKLALHQVIKWV